MKCKCGRLVSRHMKGICMKCRYEAQRFKRLRLKVDPRRLPVPKLEPTRACRIDMEEERQHELWPQKAGERE